MAEETPVSTIVDEHRQQGNTCYNQGHYAEAVQWYTKAINEDNANAFLYNNRSAAYLMMNKHLEAYKDASRSVFIDPKNVKFLMRLAKCCLNLGELAEAKRLCATIRQFDPSNTALNYISENMELLLQTYHMYEHQLSRSDLRHALHLITKCTEIAPGSLQYKMLRISLLIQLKRFTEAKSCVETLLKSHESSVELLFYRGLCLYYLEHLDKAICHFQHVLKLHPDHIDTQKAYKRAKNLLRLKEQGNAYIRDRRFSKAYEAYTEALGLDELHNSLNAKLYCNRACALFNLNRFEESLKDCNSAISLDSNYVKAYTRRAKCYSALEEHEKAVEEWTHIVKMDGTTEHKRGLQSAKLALAKSKQRDYYKILGLKKTASFDEIKQAYKKNALLHHPDRHTHADETTKQEEERKFKEVGEAYSVLSDPHKRQMYDNGEYATPDTLGQTNVSAQNIFTQVFPGFGTSTVHFVFS